MSPPGNTLSSGSSNAIAALLSLPTVTSLPNSL